MKNRHCQKTGKNISLKKLKLQVIDGDTFDADFNRNGRFSNPQERVRLLYVDTLELKKSNKGKDPKLGLPAKGFLRTVLSKTNAVLWVDPKNKTGNYGRLLAVLEVKGHNINLALIKRGHSYFNTRYVWPDGFKTYALAEAYAFERYTLESGVIENHVSAICCGLGKRGKTVYSTRNQYFVAKIQIAEVIDLSK